MHFGYRAGLGGWLASLAMAMPLFGAALPFTYQGQLKQGGAPIQGLVDLQVGLWNKPADGDELEVVGFKAVEVVNGLFTVDLVFDPRFFNGDALFLEISVRSPADPTDRGPFETLAPRQPIRPAPYALHSFQGAGRNSLDASDGSPTNAVFVNADGDVGVGTTAPASDLHVRGKTPTGRLTLTPSVADSSAEILMTENTSATLGAFMRYDGASNQWQVLGLSRDELLNPVINGPHMVVGRDNGRVGVGTTTPATRLHVLQPTGSARIRVESGDNQAGISFLSDSTVENVLYSPNDTDDLRFFINGADRVAMTSGGAVGIGTNAPLSPLHISNGSAGVTPGTGDIATFESGGSAFVYLLTPVNNASAVFFGSPTDAEDGGIVYNVSGARAMNFRTGGNQNRMTITSTGNVGVGTTSPASRLHVAGEIRTSSGGLRFPDGTLQTTAQAAGPAGPPGPAGQACWDLNNNGVGNLATEDRNGDGVVNVNDCTGPPGPTGVPGTTFAICGANGPSCNSACNGSENVLADFSENGSGTPGAGCSAVADNGSCESISELSDTCCVCRQP